MKRVNHVKKPLIAMGVTSALIVGGIALIAPSAAIADPASLDCSSVPWMDASKSAEERTAALLEASSQHQKYRWLNAQAVVNHERTTWGSAVYPAQIDCVPVIGYANGPEGVSGTAGTTAWPAPLAVAATWDVALGESKATAHASETFDKRKQVVLGPGIASGRTPLSGRGSEYFGEDPLLSGLMAAANVRGLEDGNPDKPVASNIKHYLANEQETRSPTEQFQHRRAHTPPGLRPPLRDRRQGRRPGKCDVLLQPDQPDLGVRAAADDG